MSTAHRIVRRLLEDDDTEAKDFLLRMQPETPLEIIQRVYGTTDLLDVFVEAASKRHGSAHEEVLGQHPAMVPHCAVCGPVVADSADPAFHPEVYL